MLGKSSGRRIPSPYGKDVNEWFVDCASTNVLRETAFDNGVSGSLDAGHDG